MNAKTSVVAILLVIYFAGPLPGRLPSTVAAAEDPHAYFNSLVRRSDHWKSYSLRDPAQLTGRRDVTYDPSSDTDEHNQDAAKVVIPAFFETTSLTKPVTASEKDTVLTLETAYKPLFGRGRIFKIDNEVMVVAGWLSDTTISVTRASHGSKPAAHAAGAMLEHSTNSLRTQVRLPLGTEDGHDYFFVWDSYWTDSFIGAGKFNHKAFQFSSGGRDGDTIWLEPQVSYGRTKAPCAGQGYVASFQVRYYNKPGGGKDWAETNGNMLGPGVSPTTQACIEPNTWVRFFVRIQQRANNYDPFDMWMADERHEAVQVVTNTPVSVIPTGAAPNSISKFWFEFNSSEDELFRTDGRELVAYVRNFVALRDAGDPRSKGLLVKPVAGPPPVKSAAAPRSLRIIP